MRGDDGRPGAREPGRIPAAVAAALERFLLPLVVAVAAAGIAVPAPGLAVSAGNGIDAALAVLVFATGFSLRTADLAAVRTAWRRITVVLFVSTAALPALAWAASRLITDPVLRSGMQTVGVAPAEVATVALCVIAGGDAAVCAVILVASTVVTVLAAGPILSVMGASVTVSSAGLLTTLAVVVALPLAAGAGLRAIWSPGKRLDALTRMVTVAALLVLLWQVASQIRLDAAYTRVIAALVAYIAASAVLAGVLSLRLPAGRAAAVILPVAMRDFAVAAGFAAAAFGAAAAAPLGAYGVLVLLAGTVVTQVTGHRAQSLHHGAVRSALRCRAYRQTAMARAITTTAAMMYVGPWKPLTIDCQLAPTAYPA
jgi:predicted Na+-dependent transporter